MSALKLYGKFQHEASDVEKRWVLIPEHSIWFVEYGLKANVCLHNKLVFIADVNVYAEGLSAEESQFADDCDTAFLRWCGEYNNG